MLWENLQVLPETRQKRRWETRRAIAVVLSTSSVLLVGIQFSKRTFTEDLAFGEGNYLQQLADPQVLIAYVAVLIIAVLAWKVRNTIRAYHAREGQLTRGEFEAGLLANLAAVFTGNNVIMPIVVSMAQVSHRRSTTSSTANPPPAPPPIHCRFPPTTTHTALADVLADVRPNAAVSRL